MLNKDKIYYREPVFRPPSEAYSLLIQLTEGCSYKCDFCGVSLLKRFVIREVDDVKRDLDIARKQYGPNVTKIFFLDGNAMVAPAEKLVAVTKYANQLFPNLERCGVYSHAKDILKKSDTQLKALSEAGLKIAYVGFESGSDFLLDRVQKHATKEIFIEASKKLMKANITLSATFINGLGGDNPDLSKEHAFESADLVNKICPDDDRIWYIAFLSLMTPPGTVIFNKKVKGEFKEMNSANILKELRYFIEHIEFHNNDKANCVFRSNHASNYLPIKGVLDRDKEKILTLINYGLTHKDVLRPEFYRGL